MLLQDFQIVIDRVIFHFFKLFLIVNDSILTRHYFNRVFKFREVKGFSIYLVVCEGHRKFFYFLVVKQLIDAPSYEQFFSFSDELLSANHGNIIFNIEAVDNLLQCHIIINQKYMYILSDQKYIKCLLERIWL